MLLEWQNHYSIVERAEKAFEDLLLGTTLESKHFLENIPKYNCALQITSFGAKFIREGGFLPNFKVRDYVNHTIGFP